MKTCSVLFVVLLMCLSTQVWAAGMGTVRAAFDPDVGWVNLNTSVNDKLLVRAHVDAGLPDEDFSVTLRVRYEDGTVDVFPDVAVLSTNGEGKGNVSLEVETNPPDGSETLRRVAVRVRRAPNPLYLAIAWDLPLKPGDGPSAQMLSSDEVRSGNDVAGPSPAVSPGKAPATPTSSSWGMVKALYR